MSFWSRIERRLTDLAGEIIPDDFRVRLTAARDLVDEGQADRAAAVLEELVAERPSHAGALTLLGVVRLELGQADQALLAFGRALSVDPELADAALGAGQAQLALGGWTEAIEPLRSAVASAGGDRELLASAYCGLGVAYRHSGALDKAIRELRKAVAEDPEDSTARAMLGEALLVDERVSANEARRQLEIAAEAPECPPITWIAMGQIALADGDFVSARASFSRGLDAASATHTPTTTDEIIAALLGLGDTELASGNPRGAHEYYLRALELDSRRSEVHARIGDVHGHVGDDDKALSSYEVALELGAGADVLHRALAVALRSRDVSAAVLLANRALELDPEDRAALVARGTALMKESQSEAARATFQLALRGGEHFEARLALARLELDAVREPAAGARAASEALAALRLRPRDPRARQLLVEARQRELGDGIGAAPSDGDSAMYQLALQLAALARARPDLAEMTPQISQAASDFDHPLLVTVMGEFSSGKSTFVNAFIGADVAPTGITPTTATINVVKYGRERGGRIVYQDGRTESLAWNEVHSALAALDTERARQVRVVELLLPLEQLERVNIVDTPGLNSILPEHEAVARAFIGRADAVVWLFTANQAGKKSEREALSSIHEEGKRVLGVLNKRDQLAEGEAAKVIEYVTSELGELVEVVVPLSAREALEHRLGAEPSADGNWAELNEALEERFFARSRQIKREAASRRLGSMLLRGLEIADERRTAAAEAGATLEAAAEAIRAASSAFSEVVARERRDINAWVAELCRQAAREVLELVRPRRLPFGSHQATPADRDYLISLLDSGYEAVLARSRDRVAATLREHESRALGAIVSAAAIIGGDATADVARTAADAVRLVEARVFARCQAYLRGYLRGGYVDSFFRRDLPKIELGEDAIYHALYRDAPNLDAEIAAPLEEAGALALLSVAERLEHWAGTAEVIAYDVEVGTARVLDEIDGQRRNALS